MTELFPIQYANSSMDTDIEQSREPIVHKELPSGPLELYEFQQAPYDPDAATTSGAAVIGKVTRNTREELEMAQEMLLHPKDFEGGPRYVEAIKPKKNSRVISNSYIVKMKDLKTSRMVAAKYVEGHSQAALIAEARRLARFQHQNIATIYDLGVTKGEPGIPADIFFLMEWVDGGTLLDWNLKDREPQEIARVINEIAKGVAYMNSSGLIYADLKPTNVMMTSEGVPKIIDVGISRDVPHGVMFVNGPLGTVAYCPPEQSHGELSIQTDVYSLAATFFSMISKNAHFHFDVDSRSLFMLGDESFLEFKPSIARAFRNNPESLEELKRILRRALDHDPWVRHRSVDELNQELQAVLSSLRPDSTLSNRVLEYRRKFTQKGGEIYE